MAKGTSLLPVELRRVNHVREHQQRLILTAPGARPYNAAPMATPSLSQIAERVDRLLVRHAEVQRTNALLCQQISELTQERDSLRSRLQAARARIDALLDRLPTHDDPEEAP